MYNCNNFILEDSANCGRNIFFLWVSIVFSLSSSSLHRAVHDPSYPIRKWYFVKPLSCLLKLCFTYGFHILVHLIGKRGCDIFRNYLVMNNWHPSILNSFLKFLLKNPGKVYIHWTSTRLIYQFCDIATVYK